MSKEKQIEETAEVLRHSCDGECFRNKDGFADCEVCEACLLYNAGYRKQSEVAREIILEIDTLICCHANGDIDDKNLYMLFDELKKKYIGGE